MWERLLNLFKNETSDDQFDQTEDNLSEDNEFSADQSSTTNTSPIKSHAKGTYNGPARLIGFNYLKKRGENEETPRKFISLSKLLRGHFR